MGAVVQARVGLHHAVWGLTPLDENGLKKFDGRWGVDAATAGVAHFERLVFEQAG